MPGATASLPCVLRHVTACGGGGGGGAPGPVASDLHLQLDGVTIDAGQADGTITVILDPLPPGMRPALFEADLVFDAARLRPSPARPPLLALQGEPTLDGGMRQGTYHVICGDDRNPAATSLQAG